MQFFIEILKNVSFNWNDFVRKAGVYSIDNKYKTVRGMNISWPIAEQFPSCQPLDLFDYFDMEAKTPLQILFTFYLVDNMQVTFLLEDRNRVTSRSIYENRVYF